MSTNSQQAYLSFARLRLRTKMKIYNRYTTTEGHVGTYQAQLFTKNTSMIIDRI